MKNHRFALAIAIVSLALGTAIYFGTRSETIFLNQGLAQVAEGKILFFLQGLVSNEWVPDWIIFSLPDALWMMALTLSILMVWNFKFHRKSITWLALAAGAGIFLEIFQGFHFVRGTFDPLDLLFVLLAAFIPTSFIYLKQRLCESI